MKKNKFCGFILAVAVCAIAFPVYAGIKFDNLDLNNDDYLIYTASHNFPGTPEYKSLFLTKLDEKKLAASPVLITCFPEKLELLEGGRILQVRNRYGIANYSVSAGTLKWISQASRIPTEYTHLGPQSVSPDGKWICYVIQKKNAMGQLVIYNVQTKQTEILADSYPFSYSDTGVRWAADSKAFLYEKNNMIYFDSPEAVFKKIRLSENYRKIGEGTINSVQWAASKIVYIKDDIVYHINENELYTRGLYSSVIGYGKISARLSNPFNSFVEKFSCSSDGENVVVISGNILFYYEKSKIKNMIPLSSLDGSVVSHQIFWTEKNEPVLWSDLISNSTGKKLSTVNRVSLGLEKVLQVEGGVTPILSPDKRKVAFCMDGKFCVYDTSSWKLSASLENSNVVSAVWANNANLFVGGNETVKLWNVGGQSTVLFVSSANFAYWDGGRIICRLENGKDYYVYEALKNTWSAYKPTVLKNEHTEKNGIFRVYTAKSQNPKFENGIYVRSLADDVVTYSVYGEADSSSLAKKKITLSFDVLENADGLANVLYTLEEFNIKGTFFLNGEFIRRYPEKAKQVAESGNLCASLFFSSADLTGADFTVDKAFVKRGLARNEDEFFAATGKELSLFWHAPYYHTNKSINSAAEEAGYTWISPSFKLNDEVTFENAAEGKGVYKSANEIIDDCVENLVADKNSSHIFVAIGKTGGTRKDYLYEKLDLLIAALLDAGYEIVPMTDFEHQKF